MRDPIVWILSTLLVKIEKSRLFVREILKYFVRPNSWDFVQPASENREVSTEISGIFSKAQIEKSNGVLILLVQIEKYKLLHRRMIGHF